MMDELMDTVVLSSSCSDSACFAFMLPRLIRKCDRFTPSCAQWLVWKSCRERRRAVPSKTIDIDGWATMGCLALATWRGVAEHNALVLSFAWKSGLDLEAPVPAS